MRCLLAVLVLLAVPAQAAEPCQGTLSGKVKGSFACDAGIVTNPDGKPVFVVNPRGPIEGVPAYAPGAFELRTSPRQGTFILDDLGMGKASVAADGGAFYSATKTTSQRGEVKLVLRSVTKDPKVKGNWIVHGTYWARLPPAGGGKEGEVVVEVKF
jgi:hypothetical protein